MSNARTEVLERVTRAIADGGSPAPQPIGYRRTGTLDAEARVALFATRVGEYRAEVRRLEASGVAQSIAEIAEGRGARRIGVAPAFPAVWRPSGVDLVADMGLTAAQLDRLDAALTGCTAAIAETGTIILTAQEQEGRRALTLVPDLHICVVRESQICELVPEALELLGRESLERRPITLISGPSATSDIELSRVEGVHGPRDLVVLIVNDA